MRARTVRIMLSARPIARDDKDTNAHQLVRKHEYGLKREVAVAHLEQALQVGTKAVDDEHIVVTLLATPHDPRNTLRARQSLVDA